MVFLEWPSRALVNLTAYLTPGIDLARVCLQLTGACYLGLQGMEFRTAFAQSRIAFAALESAVLTITCA